MDVCSGAGGWACAARGLPIDIVYAVDREADCLATYKLNFPKTEVLTADLLTPGVIDDLGQWFRSAGCDVLLGGIPCEQVSRCRRIAKASAGELATVERLVDSLLRLVDLGAPRWWCFEDVAAILRRFPGALFPPHFQLDSARFSGQRRKRVYIGNAPVPELGSSTAVAGDVFRPGPYRVGSRLFPRTPSRNKTMARDVFYPIEAGEKAPTILEFSSRHDPAMAVVDSGLPGGKRQMEWQEAARLQGFPEDFVFVGSPGRVGKMIGQAVQIDTARAILEAMVEAAKGGRNGEGQDEVVRGLEAAQAEVDAGNGEARPGAVQGRAG
jgi:site-specific DNA-cytosine methylase